MQQERMVVGQGPNHEHVEHGVTEKLEPLLRIGRYVSNHGQMHDGFMLNPWIGEMVVDQELKLTIVILWYCEAIGRRDKIQHWAQMFNNWEKNMCTLDRPRQFPVKAAPMSISTTSASILIDMVRVVNAVSAAISLLTHSSAHFVAAKNSRSQSTTFRRVIR